MFVKSAVNIFLDFHSTKQALPLVDSWSHESMVESGVTEGGKNSASFLFRESTQQLEHKNEASS